MHTINIMDSEVYTVDGTKQTGHYVARLSMNIYIKWKKIVDFLKIASTTEGEVVVGSL